MSKDNCDSPDFVFDKTYTALMWISAGPLRRKDLKEVFSVTEIKKPGDTFFQFFGCSFGRYDLMFEFTSQSPRVASYFEKKVQKTIKTVINSRFSASSLVLGHKVIFKNARKEKKENKTALRAYAFINPTILRNKASLNKLLNYIQTLESSNLYWNNSVYSFVLSIDGDSFIDTFSKIFKIKEQIPDDPLPISTYFVLGWDQNAGDFCQDKPTFSGDLSLKIPAVVYVKIKNNPKWTTDCRLTLTPAFLKMFSSKNFQARRPGWLDEAVFLEAETLSEIKNSVYDLREKNAESIAQTSTILLFPLENCK